MCNLEIILTILMIYWWLYETQNELHEEHDKVYYRYLSPNFRKFPSIVKPIKFITVSVFVYGNSITDIV